MFDLDKVKSWVLGQKGCVYCGSWHATRWSICEVCLTELETLEIVSRIIRRPYLKFDCHAAFARQGNQRTLSSVLCSSIKQAQNSLFISESVWKFFPFFEKIKQNSKNVVLIPCPRSPASTSSSDHALAIAQNIQKITGWALESESLAWSHYSPQKSLAFDRRRGRAFTNIGKKYKGETILFVDDIITTGFTAKAAFEALEKPKRFYGLFLFHQLRNRQT